MASRRAKAASRGFPRVTNHESPIIGLEENLQIVVNVGRTSGANDDAASLAEPLLLAARSPQESRHHSGSRSIAGSEPRRKYCDLHPHQRLVAPRSPPAPPRAPRRAFRGPPSSLTHCLLFHVS